MKQRHVIKMAWRVGESGQLFFHDLRRLYANWLAEDGYTHDDTAVALGQTSTSVTSRDAQPRLTRELKLRKVR